MGESTLPTEELVRELYDEHGPALLRYVRRLMHGDLQLAEDIVQETLLRAWRHADKGPDRVGRPWLFTTARHLVIDTYRARSARPTEASPNLLEAVAVDGQLDASLDAVLLADAMRSLSADHRTVLIHCYFRGLTAAQAAAELGVPAGTVRSRVHYALRALRLALEERGVNQP